MDRSRENWIPVAALCGFALMSAAGAAVTESPPPGQANAHMHQRSFAELVAAFESAERDAWQKPELVMELLGDLEGKTVVDIGSGTGYFSFRLAAAGARVICADVDPRFLDYIRARLEEAELPADAMELRRVPPDSPALAPGEADLVLMVDTYHHIEDRVAYFEEVRAGLAPGGRLVVVDFFKRDTPVGPPVSMKLAPETVVDELRAAGFRNVDVDRRSLPYQYIVTAY